MYIYSDCGYLLHCIRYMYYRIKTSSKDDSIKVMCQRATHCKL